MDLRYSSEQIAFKDSVRRFAEQNLADGALARAHDKEYAWDVARLLAENGLLGITLPQDVGGQGGTIFDAVIALEEVAAVCPTSADVLHTGNFGPIWTMWKNGSEQQVAEYLPQLLAGRGLISIGMSEPDAGSALTELRTAARRDGDDYIINGTKLWSTHSADATVFLIYVRFGPGFDGIGSVLIDRDTPGLRFGPPSNFMSGEQWVQLYFDDCRIPKEKVLLGPGGFKKQIAGFNVERIGNSTRSLSVGRYAFNIAKEHLLSRRQFGRRLAEFQGLQWMFAETAVKLDAAQFLLYRAALAEGEVSGHHVAMAKFACNAAGFEAANLAVQAMGASGYSCDSLVEYCLRRTRGWQIAGGTTEMLKNRIAEGVFEARFSQRPS